MFAMTLSLLAANLAEVKVIPVEASARQRLRFDRNVSCVTLAATPKNPTGAFRIQCDRLTHRCLAAPNGQLDADGMKLEVELERTAFCAQDVPEGVTDDWVFSEAIAEAKPGWYRDERGRVMQVVFDLSRRVHFGGAWSPFYRPDGQGGVGRAFVELGTFISWQRDDSVWRLRLLEGSAWLGPDNRFEAHALSLGSSKRIEKAPVFITTFLGGPRRFDVPLALSWGLELGHLESIGGRTFFAPAELDASVDLWTSKDLESFVRLRFGPGVEYEIVTKDWAFRPGAALEADVTLDPKGHHHLVGVALWEQRFGGAAPGLRLKARFGYEALLFALNDYPVTFLAELRGAWRTDVPALPGFEMSGHTGLRFSLWAPERRHAEELTSPRG
jgi:hypothetical protein